VARLIFLDSGPLGVATRRPGDDEGDRCRAWIIARAIGGDLVLIPELADYEVRRGLLGSGNAAAVHRLDDLKTGGFARFLPINSEAMLRAAELWADLRRRGLPTAPEDRLDGDAILAGQAIAYSGHGDEVVIATDNRKHLARFPRIHRADGWEKIK
jgi:predicted nucleic acid-binding protein